jgi:hypothetical protein
MHLSELKYISFVMRDEFWQPRDIGWGIIFALAAITWFLHGSKTQFFEG